MNFNRYYEALGLNDEADLAAIKKAYATIAGNGEHPDHGGDPERFKLITAAFNELKAMKSKKRGYWGRNSDLAWARAWDDLNKPAATEEPKTEEPKAEQPKAKRTSYMATHGTGTKSDRSKRCGMNTASGPCVRPLNHPHGHMSQAVKDRKVANAKAKRASAA